MGIVELIILVLLLLWLFYFGRGRFATGALAGGNLKHTLRVIVVILVVLRVLSVI